MHIKISIMTLDRSCLFYRIQYFWSRQATVRSVITSRTETFIEFMVGFRATLVPWHNFGLVLTTRPITRKALLSEHVINYIGIFPAILRSPFLISFIFISSCRQRSLDLTSFMWLVELINTFVIFLRGISFADRYAYV